MHLPPMGREYYRLDITTNPPVDPTAWEASFDNGQTWSAAVEKDGAPAWLVRGPQGPAHASVVATITADTEPLVRLTDSPEVVIRSAPTIFLAIP